MANLDNISTGNEDIDYPPLMTELEIKQIIQEEMEKSKETLSPKAARKFRFYTVKGPASFKCTLNHSKTNNDSKNKIKYWSSAHAWCVIDLKMKKICKKPKYYQGCKKHWFKGKPEPRFTKDNFRKMVAHAITKLKVRKGKIQMPVNPTPPDTEKNTNGAHDEKRCTMCKKRKRPCWKKRT